MSMNPHKSLKLVLTNIFRKRGGSGIYTKLFDEFSSAEQQSLLKELEMTQGEEPVIVCMRSGTEWTAITTSNVISQSNSELIRLEIQTLVSVRPADFHISEKRGWKVLACRTRAGIEHTFEFEPGGSFIAVWNVLKHAIEYYRSRSD